MTSQNGRAYDLGDKVTLLRLPDGGWRGGLSPFPDCFSPSLLFSPAGLVEARFDKIHMFDVQLPGGEVYRESKNYQPGDAAVLAELPWGTLGLTVCYDLRFPHLYRALAKAGADALAIPSAFTRKTGENFPP